MQEAAELMSAEAYDWLGLVNSPRGHQERTRYREWMKIRFDEASADLADGRISAGEGRALPHKRCNVRIQPARSLSQSMLDLVNEGMLGSGVPADDLWFPESRTEVGKAP